MKNHPTRRDFLKTSAALAVSLPLYIPGRALGKDGHVAASDRIVMGMVGVGRQGQLNTQGFLCFPEVQIVATCDCYENHAEKAALLVNKAYGTADCRAYWDFREITLRDDIDAVFVGTTEHWHPYISIHAMRHGKDVYCEKPETFTVRDGRLMQQTAEKFGRVFSGGSQRVWNDYNHFHKIIRAGLIGEVVEGHANNGASWYHYRPATSEPIPRGLHWDMYLGPAPELPFNAYLIGAAGGSNLEFAPGGMLGYGAHSFGGVMFAMQLDHTGPSRIIPPDGKDVKFLTFEFADGRRIFEGSAWGNIQGFRRGLPGFRGGLISFRGTEGSLAEDDIAEARYPIPDIEIPHYRGPILDPALVAGQHKDWPLLASAGKTSIHGDFLYCVRHRAKPFRDIESCHRVCTLGHLGNIANYLKRELRFDPVREEIIGDAEAAAWLDRDRRTPWELETRATKAIPLAEASKPARIIVACKPAKAAEDYLPELAEKEREFAETSDRESRERILKRVRILANQQPVPVAVYGRMLEQNAEIAAQKQILESMGRACSGVPALEFALAYMDKATDVRPNAALAVVRIANATRYENAAAARKSLATVRREVDHADVCKRATDVLVQIGIDAWGIRPWAYAGPYSLSEKDGKKLHATPFGPEAGEPTQWTPCQIGWVYHRLWDLESAIAPGEFTAAYLRTYVFSPEAQTVHFEAGATGPLKVRLNGNLTLDECRRGPYRMGDFSATLPLDAGWNELLVKTTHEEGAWNFSARFCLPDRTDTVPGLKFSREKDY